MEKGNKIIVDYNVKKKLLILGSYPTIRKALAGDVETPQKIQIRKAAIENGGVEIEQEEIKKDSSSESPSCSFE